MRGIISTLVCLLLASSTARAQNIPEIIRQRDQIIGKENIHEQRLQEQFRQQTAPPESTPAEEPSESGDPGPAFRFHQIKLEGATVLSDYDLSEYLNRPIHIAEINQILRDITNRYVELGFVTTRVLIPEQDLTHGVLTLRVIEGKVAQVVVQRNGIHREDGRHVVPIEPGCHLNLRDMEQGWDQISRLKSYQAKADLAPGRHPGESDVVMDTHQGFPLFFGLRYDNYGASSTGQNQIEVQALAEDLFGLYEAWGVDARRDLDFTDADHYNKGISFQASLPVGYYTMRYFGSLFEYQSSVQAQFNKVRYSGNTQSHRAEMEYLFHRNSQSKSSLIGSLTRKQVDNYVQNIFIAASSKKLTVLGLGLSHSHRLWGGAVSANLSYNYGMSFNKINLDLRYAKPFKIGEGQWCFSTKLSGQYSPNFLYSVERISIGGAQTVRGFQKDSLSGDSGLYWRNELEKQLFTQKFFGQVDGVVGIDYGWVPKQSPEILNHGQLASVLTGLRSKDGIATSELMVAYAIKKPTNFRNEGLVIHVRIGLYI